MRRFSVVHEVNEIMHEEQVTKTKAVSILEAKEIGRRPTQIWSDLKDYSLFFSEG